MSLQRRLFDSTEEVGLMWLVYFRRYRRWVIIAIAVLALVVVLLLAASSVFRAWMLGAADQGNLTIPSKRLQSIAKRLMKIISKYKEKRR